MFHLKNKITSIVLKTVETYFQEIRIKSEKLFLFGAQIFLMLFYYKVGPFLSAY